MRAIGIDVGGTNVRVALVDEGGTVLEQSRGSTPPGDVRGLAAVMGRLVAEHDPDLPVGLGIAGGVSDDGVLVFGPNLRMEGEQVRAPLEHAVGRPLVIANDASVAAWGEHRVGAGRGHPDLVLLTIGTGIGSGAVIEGRLLTGAHDVGAELGHTVVHAGGDLCPCGNRGCLEAYGAGRRFATGDRSSEEVVEAALAGDAAALEHLAGIGRWLGIGVHNAVAVFDPEVVLIGGGAGQAAFDVVVGSIESTLAALLVGRGHRPPPPVRRAALGDDAGVVGAALLALDRAAGTSS